MRKLIACLLLLGLVTAPALARDGEKTINDGGRKKDQSGAVTDFISQKKAAEFWDAYVQDALRECDRLSNAMPESEEYYDAVSLYQDRYFGYKSVWTTTWQT